MKSDKQKPDGNEKAAEEVLFFEPEGTDFGPKEQLDFACAAVRALKLKPNLRNMADRTPGRLAETKPFCRTARRYRSTSSLRRWACAPKFLSLKIS